MPTAVVMWFWFLVAFEYMIEATDLSSVACLYIQNLWSLVGGWDLNPLSPRSPQGTIVNDHSPVSQPVSDRRRTGT